MARSRLLVVALALLGTAWGSPASAQVKSGVRPVVAGFERFHRGADGDAVKGGRLLLAELNCTSCHRAEPGLEAVLTRREPPLLDGVGARVKPAYLRRFLSDPQATKPGTPMPHVLGGVPEAERQEKVEALVHFLASTGTPKTERPQKKLVGVGRELYQRVGCVACHGTRNSAGEQDRLFTASVPLGDLKAKYTLGSLKSFLENPHATRRSGRMPKLLDGKEATEVANYLMQGVADPAGTVNMKYAYYEGSWEQLPNFDDLKPAATGESSGLDLALARRQNNFAMKFEGWLKIDTEGQYKFWLTSDDGSKLWIDGQLVVSNDGIHAPNTQTAATRLAKGTHKLVAAVFNAGGGVELDIDVQGAGISKQPVTSFIHLTPEGSAPVKAVAKAEDAPFVLRPELAEKGRSLFAAVGCTNCHQLTQEKKIPGAVSAPALAKARPGEGCLAPAPTAKAPWYALDDTQRKALAAALKAPTPAAKSEPNEVIARSMTAFNCYACHERGKVGGVTEELNPYFTTTQPEMGDEGRIPPTLTGVGAKLNPEYLRFVLDKGAHDRPYMHTRMPGFGNDHVGHLVALFTNVDPPEKAPKVAIADKTSKVKAEARHLIGGQALGCIKCHTFAGHKAEGVQGIDMTLLTKRLNRDWFHNYLLNPNKYRPGTRMPAAWPDGQVMLPKFLGGSADKQIEGIWVYLNDGNKALLPVGMKKQSIPLVPTTEAIVYRNFIEGAGPRAIAVGYPEQAHLAFDANNLRLAMIWQGAFIDASRHWTDRGVGYEPPLGDNVLSMPTQVSFAALADPDAPWPTKSAKELPGYQFKGYRLTKDQRPTFLYTAAGAAVEDFPNPVKNGDYVNLRRELTVTGRPANLYFRAAVGSKIETLKDGWYRINGEWTVRIEGDARPIVRGAGGLSELLVPVIFQNGKARIVQEFQW